MTPTTITRADELATKVEVYLEILRDNGYSGNPLNEALTAYRAARSTDGACDDTARLDWLDTNGKPETFEDAPYTTVWCLIGATGQRDIRAAIDAARAASGSGEAG